MTLRGRDGVSSSSVELAHWPPQLLPEFGFSIQPMCHLPWAAWLCIAALLANPRADHVACRIRDLQRRGSGFARRLQALASCRGSGGQGFPVTRLSGGAAWKKQLGWWACCSGWALGRSSTRRSSKLMKYKSLYNYTAIWGKGTPFYSSGLRTEPSSTSGRPRAPPQHNHSSCHGAFSNRRDGTHSRPQQREQAGQVLSKGTVPAVLC